MTFLQEAVTKAILNSLSSYICHFNEEQVKVGLWAGDLVLEDVEVKWSAINTYDSPVHVKHGCIQRIRIQVPWTSFWHHPIQIDVSGVDCELHLRGTYDILHELQQKNFVVQGLLANARASVAHSYRGWSSLFSGLSTSILDRLVRNIAVRIDDVNIYHAIAPITLGLTLHSLTFQDAAPARGEGDAFNTTTKVLDITDLALYATVGDTPVELMAPVHVHVQFTHCPATATTTRCLVQVPTLMALHIPLALEPYLAKVDQARRSFAAGARLKCCRWLTRLHGTTPKSPWQYARQAMLAGWHDAATTPSTTLKDCYTTLYTKWLDSPQTSVAFMHRLNWLELQLSVADIFAAQVDASGRATSSRGRPVRLAHSPDGPILPGWSALDVSWDAAGVSLIVDTGPFQAAVTLQQLHGRLQRDDATDTCHIEVDSIEMTWQRDNVCILRLGQSTHLAGASSDDAYPNALSTGLSVLWSRQACGSVPSTAVDIVMSSARLHVNATSPLGQLWTPDSKWGDGLPLRQPVAAHPCSPAVSCTIHDGSIAVQVDSTCAIDTAVVDFYVKLHPHHQFQLRAASWAVGLMDGTAARHDYIRAATLSGLVVCATDSFLSKSIRADVAAAAIAVCPQLVRVCMRAADVVDAMSQQVAATHPAPPTVWLGDGRKIVAATLQCAEVDVVVMDPTKRAFDGGGEWPPKSAFSTTKIRRLALEGLWQHRALQHGRASAQDILFTLEQVHILHVVASASVPHGVVAIVRQDSSLLPPGDSVAIDCDCGNVAVVFDPDALCQAMSHARTYVALTGVDASVVRPRSPSNPVATWGYRLAWRTDSMTIELRQHDRPLVKSFFSRLTVYVLASPPPSASIGDRVAPPPLVDVIIHRVYMFDQTEAGVALHRTVAMPMQCDCATTDQRCNCFTYSNHSTTGGSSHEQATVHAIQCTCLWRFYLELWNYLYDRSGGVAMVAAHYRHTFPSMASDATTPCDKTPMRVVFQQVAICLPRNSDSIDMMAIVMGECILTKSFETDTWQYGDAMVAGAAALAPSKDGPLPTDGPRQTNRLHMKQVTMYCADTESVVQRQWSFRRGTHAATTPSIPSTSRDEVDPLPAPAAPITEGAALALDPDVLWKRVTVMPFDLLFVRDFDAANTRCTRDLYVIQPGLRLSLELTDLSIVLSLWYDNLGEYPQFPTPFVPPTNYCEPYTTGPHPHFAPYTSPSQLPAIHGESEWEVGCVMLEVEIRLPLQDHAFLALQLHPVVIQVDGRLDSSFMRCTVVGDRGTLVKRSAPGVPPVVLVDLVAADVPFHLANVNVYAPFDGSVQVPSFGLQMSVVRFPYGYTMMGLRLSHVTVGLASDPDVLAFVIEFFSTYFYDSEYGYPWPTADALAPHVGARTDMEMGVNDLIYSKVITVHAPCIPLAMHDRVFRLQASSAEVGWELRYESTATDALVKVHLPGVEGLFLDPGATPASVGAPPAGVPRTVLTPITIHWSYATNMLTGQQSMALDIARFDVEFPNEDDLTVFVYGTPSDVGFFVAIAAAYEASWGDAPPELSPAAMLDGAAGDGDDELDDEESGVEASGDSWMSITVRLPRKVGFVWLDDVLHFQKPVVQVLLCDVVVHALQCQDPDDQDDNGAQDGGDRLSWRAAPAPADGSPAVFAKLTSSLQLDVFNNIVRAWEPLVEPFAVNVFLEQNGPRLGVAISTPDSVQINVTEYCVNAALESWGHRGSPRAAATVGLVNWTGKAVRYFQPQPHHHPHHPSLCRDKSWTSGHRSPLRHRPRIVHVNAPKRNVADGSGTAGPLACPPTLSVLVGRHKVETTVLNQNDLHVLFASAHPHTTDAFRHALCGDAAAAELTYDMSVQLFGFQWLHHLDLNQSGFFYFDLVPEVPHIQSMPALPAVADKRVVPPPIDDAQDGALPLPHLVTSTAAVRAALRCLVHVNKTRWGHRVTLQSLFQVQNHTSFVLSVALHASSKLRQDAHHHAIQLSPGGIHCVPLQPLFEHAANSQGKHIGFLHLNPSTSSPSLDGIHLLDLASRPSKFIHTCQPKTHLCVEVTSSCCHATKKGRWSRLFRPSASFGSTTMAKASDDKDASQLTTLILHAPLTLQNLLCVNIVCCVFRIVASSPAPPSSSGRDVVWEGTIKTGGHAAIYASNLADKLYCSVLLPALQCETVKPALLHVPPSSKAKVDTTIAFADKTNNTQPLKLKVENTVGSGGQRAVILYASYWLVNLTPFGLQYKQDTRHFEIAGSAAALARRQSIDGDKQNLWNVLACDLELGPYLNPVDAADDGLHAPSLSCMPSIRPQDGRCSFVADSHELCYCSAPTCAVRRLARFATMFSFGGGGNSVGGLEDTMTAAFTNSLCIKCPKYSWSKGVSLEVLGVDQVVELKNTTHVLELGVKIVPGPD
ncbi:hypothetical protein H310_02723, partial [Aphanomyces invadans]